MAKRALVVSPQPFFSPRGTPFSVYYRTLITAELGIEVDLLTYGQGQDVAIDGVRIIRIPGFSALGQVKVGPSRLKLFLDIFIALYMIALLLRRRYDFVHAHEEAVFIAWVLKPLFGFKLIYDMHSSLSQQLTNFNFTRSRFLIRLFELLENAALESAEGVITICPDLYHFANGIISDRRKHFLIENSIFEDVKLKDPPPAETAENIQWPDNIKALEKRVVYAGTLEPYQGIDILLKAFAIVVKKNPEAGLLIAGGTPEQVKKYWRLCTDLNLDANVALVGRVPQTVAKAYTRMAQVLVSPRSEGTNTPLKIYEQLASGVPLVATSIYSHTQVLNDEVAFLVSPTPEGMAKGMVAAMAANGAAAKKTAAAARLYRDEYSRAVYTRKMHNLMELMD